MKQAIIKREAAALKRSNDKRVLFAYAVKLNYEGRSLPGRKRGGRMRNYNELYRLRSNIKLLLR